MHNTNIPLVQRLIFGISAVLFLLMILGGMLRVVLTEHRLPPITEMYQPYVTRLMEAEEYERAEHQFRVAIALDLSAKRSNLFHGLGTALVQQGKQDEAIFWLQKTLKSEPKAAAVHLSLGKAFLEKGESERALNHWQQALDLGPDDTELRISLGDLLMEKGVALLEQRKLDEAEVHFCHALDIAPNATSFLNRGVFYARTGQLDRAVEDFTQAIRLKPDFADGYINRGKSYHQIGKIELAVADYTRLLELAPPAEKPQYSRRLELLKAESSKRRETTDPRSK